MKLYTLIAIMITLTGFTAQLSADDYSRTDEDIEKLHQSVEELNISANLTAQRTGVAEGSISCDAGFIRCSCKGAINCAWLALACGESDGVQGFDGECFFPDAVPGVRDSVNNFASLNNTEKATCDGIFCSCTGPSDSADCKTIRSCIDDVTCIGDNCGCIGGSVD